VGTRSDVRSRTPSGACHGSRRPRIGRRCCEHPSACHPRYSPESSSSIALTHREPLRLLQYQCFSRSVALYPDSPLFARSQPPHLGSSVGDFMRSSVPEGRCFSPRSSSVPGILDTIVSINPPAPYSHGRPQQLARVRLQGVFCLACFQPLYILEGGRSRYEVGFAFAAV
jgi:hypothetical protein